MNVYVVGHGLHKIAGKEIVLSHVVGAVIPLRLWFVLQSNRVRQGHCMPHVGIVIEEHRLIIQIGRTRRMFVCGTKMIRLLETFKGDPPAHG